MLTAMGVMLLVIARTNPLAVKQSAFLLSFGAVLGIAWFGPLWTLEEKKKKKQKWREGLQTSLSVLLMTFPVLLQFFSEYALYSTFLNLLVIPLMSVLMAAGILCGAVGLLNLQGGKTAGTGLPWNPVGLSTDGKPVPAIAGFSVDYWNP